MCNNYLDGHFVIFSINEISRGRAICKNGEFFYYDIVPTQANPADKPQDYKLHLQKIPGSKIVIDRKIEDYEISELERALRDSILTDRSTISLTFSINYEKENKIK